jgi:hypothetical protein
MKRDLVELAHQLTLLHPEEADIAREPARVAPIGHDDLDLASFEVALLRYDAELEEKLLDIVGEMLAEDRGRAVPFVERTEECGFDCRTSAPDERGHAFVGAAESDHLVEWAGPNVCQVLDIELIDDALGSDGPRVRISRAADDHVIGPEHRGVVVRVDVVETAAPL